MKIFLFLFSELHLSFTSLRVLLVLERQWQTRPISLLRLSDFWQCKCWHDIYLEASASEASSSTWVCINKLQFSFPIQTFRGGNKKLSKWKVIWGSYCTDSRVHEWYMDEMIEVATSHFFSYTSPWGGDGSQLCTKPAQAPRLARFTPTATHRCAMNSPSSRRALRWRYKEFWSVHRISRVCSFVGHGVDGAARCWTRTNGDN